jgi:hypothetical protein
LTTGCGFFAYKTKTSTEVIEKDSDTIISAGTTAIGDTSDSDTANGDTSDSDTANGDTSDGNTSNGDSDTSVTEVGEGAKSFSFEVVGKDGTSEFYNVKTDETTVGAALLALDLIAGDTFEQGIMVKSVGGVQADYDKDGAYWAFYIDGEYASVGVDSTNIEDGKTYSFKYEKA